MPLKPSQFLTSQCPRKKDIIFKVYPNCATESVAQFGSENLRLNAI